MKTKKYFGEKPLEGPIPFGSMYRDAPSETKERTDNNKHHNPYTHNNRNLPYPTSAELAEYERVCKGSSHQIIAMLDKDQIHKQKLSIKSLNAKILTKRIEIFLSFLLMLAIVSATVFLSYNGYIIPASLVAVSGIVSALCIYKYNTQSSVKPNYYNRNNHYNKNKK